MSKCLFYMFMKTSRWFRVRIFNKNYDNNWYKREVSEGLYIKLKAELNTQENSVQFVLLLLWILTCDLIQFTRKSRQIQEGQETISHVRVT